MLFEVAHESATDEARAKPAPVDLVGVEGLLGGGVHAKQELAREPEVYLRGLFHRRRSNAWRTVFGSHGPRPRGGGW